ncbi:MAG: type II secretion system F family protein [bacterium]
MPDYQYTAKDKNGNTVKGILAATDSNQLDKLLETDGFYLLTSKEIKKSSSPTARSSEHNYNIKIKRRELIMFTDQLAILLSVGIPLLTGLTDLTNQAENPNVKEALMDIRDKIEAGSVLSDAMSAYPRIFSNFYINIVKAGEFSGNMPRSLNRLQEYLEWQEDLVAKIKQITTYPLILGGFILGLLILLLGFVFPRFMKIFESLNLALPLPTRIIIGLSNFVQYRWYYLVISFVTLIIAYQILIRNQKTRLIIDRLKLSLPIVGPLFCQIEVSMFSRNLSILIQSGVEITKSLGLVEQILGNSAMARSVKGVQEKIIAGGSMAESLKGEKGFTPMLIRMLDIGERSGQIEKTLLNVSAYYDKNIPNTIKKVFSIVEPMIVVVAGLFVLVIALSIFLPLFQMSRGITGR